MQKIINKRGRQIDKETSSTGGFLKKNMIFSIGLTIEPKNKILEYVVESVEKGDKKIYIVTPNPEIIVYASRHPEFRIILNTADISLKDGVGLTIAGKILGIDTGPRITGVDFLKELCVFVEKKPITVGFLGAMAGVAKRASDCLKKQLPELKIQFAVSEFTEIPQEILDNPNAFPDILFVAFGFPKQETWIFNHKDNLPAKVMIGVGGAFNELAGIEKNPPEWVKKNGLKWLWRLSLQPWRWRRQLALFEFIRLVFKEKIKR